MKLITFLAFLLIVPSVGAVQLGEGLYISLPPETIRCIDITLPGDAGVFSPGLVDYELTSDANWGDMTEQLVTTDENNSVKVPMCFSSFNRKEGDCSNFYSIQVGAKDLGVSKSFEGGVCVSKFPDIEYGAPKKGKTPKDVLNNNADIFDIAFRSSTVFTENDNASISVIVESYASVVLEVQGKGLTPSKRSISLSPTNSKAILEFTAPLGVVEMTASIKGCKGSFCSKIIKGEVKAKPSGGLAGFSASLFPRSISVKNLDPVKYEITIVNYGEEKEFEVELFVPDDVKTDFKKKNLTVKNMETVEFEATPTESSSIYLFNVEVVSEGNKKSIFGSLSTDELLTDSMREAEELKRRNPADKAKIDEKMDSWFAAYEGKEYGEELDDYAELKEGFREFDEPDPDARQEPKPDDPIPPRPQSTDYTLIIIGIVAALAAGIVLFLVFGRKKKSGVKIEGIEKGF